MEEPFNIAKQKPFFIRKDRTTVLLENMTDEEISDAADFASNIIDKSNETISKMERLQKDLRIEAGKRLRNEYVKSNTQEV